MSVVSTRVNRTVVTGTGVAVAVLREYLDGVLTFRDGRRETGRQTCDAAPSTEQRKINPALLRRPR